MASEIPGSTPEEFASVLEEHADVFVDVSKPHNNRLEGVSFAVGVAGALIAGGFHSSNQTVEIAGRVFGAGLMAFSLGVVVFSSGGESSASLQTTDNNST